MAIFFMAFPILAGGQNRKNFSGCHSSGGADELDA